MPLLEWDSPCRGLGPACQPRKAAAARHHQPAGTNKESRSLGRAVRAASHDLHTSSAPIAVGQWLISIQRQWSGIVLCPARRHTARRNRVAPPIWQHELSRLHWATPSMYMSTRGLGLPRLSRRLVRQRLLLGVEGVRQDSQESLVQLPSPPSLIVRCSREIVFLS